jgi:cell division septation protein DedD
VQVVAKTAATPRPPVEPAVVASSAPPNDAPLPALAGRFAIQVAAVRQRTEADRITHDLMEQGYSAYVVNGNGTAAGLYRVRIGAFPDHRAAETVAKQVEETNGTGALWIVNDAIR